MYILIVEDSDDLAANIGEYCEERGDIVDYAADGLTGLHLAAVNRYDVLVLDLSLPGLDGLSLCERLRLDAGNNVPILMLTARDTLDDRLTGFETGADDYVTKPFSLPELHMRLKALVRRAAGASEQLSVADLVFDTRSLIVRRAGRRLELTPTGMRMLELLMRASPAVVRTATVERVVWGDDPPDSEAALRGHIHQLRAIIDKPFPQKLLKTVHGIGYRLADDDKL
ncbi:response regulator transcription factor [Salinisphaera sp.]|uniref:response regulator transcription factor n=1 Tax=Salinisphaera sp. TaxID=1914330 RepID=UPI000C3E8199|nr:response regulator transcription factor [Salinisphaera sp.]MBS61476.1 DNA-binding response regulator [Salinisphaera sp.]